ncbi:putative entry exclusion protein TrbK-alt [Bradyrhizobium sp. CCGB01]|uniref:putative entry exclusion protein TrbK-alt n=1 Tax=Bradyrhizobium sp. CCGB01 TaxID=2949634 RepID=UPI0020B30E66|nr:putative entry exclusion protein TrbK-alt [Bradyrhizobium sp. CCGB01]MCP3406201.1 putative entry exclusion protein TrbK-alt [Bradyrhizobium sp. CCGB01]
MTHVRTFKALSLLTAIGVLLVAACTFQLRGRDRSPALQKTEQRTEDGSELARCRQINSEEAAGYQHCKQVWAENRRRFLGRKDGVVVRADDDAAGSTVIPKDQSRVPQEYPQSATPEAGKP